MEEEIKYPIRINKYLAHKKIAARREADEFILQKRVRINGRTAVLGDKVLEKDKVEIIPPAGGFKKKIYIAFNKPKGELTTANGQKGLFYVGRLDKNSSGLLILTNDGRITDRLLNPKYDHQKEYFVKVNKNVDGLFLKKISEGVKLEDGYITKKCVIRKISKDRFSIILTEGKKHQIRRMCAVFGYSILALERKRIMNIKLGSLPQGESRKIKGKELQDFLASLGLK
jgi:23S rRNA pseudouridine2604 synthase